MPRKSIYLSEGDLAYIDAHRDVIGESLSSALMEGLRMVVTQNQLHGQGFEEVRLDVGRPGASQWKVFDGRLMARSRRLLEAGRVVRSERIYRTPKGSWVYFDRSSVNWDYWSAGGSGAPDLRQLEAEMSASFDPAQIDGYRVFEVRSTLDELADLAPAELVSQARAEAQGSAHHVERLDI